MLVLRLLESLFPAGEGNCPQVCNTPVVTPFLEIRTFNFIKMKEHHFEIEDAVKYGVEKAVLLYNIRYWVEKNKANDRNKHKHEDNKIYYWTFNSGSAFAKLFPYMNERSIRRWLQEMEDEGIIISGKFNKHNYDQTKWYSLPNYVTPLDKMTDTVTENDRPIPDNKPDKKHIRFSDENDLDSSPEVNDYLGVPLPENWVDKSFYDTDNFIPRFEDQFGRSVKQSEITALRNKAKAKPRVKEKPVKQSFNYEEELAKLRDSFHKTNKIVALIWFHKRYKFENALQMQAQFDMDKTYASKLKGYSGEQISKAIELCKQDAEELGYDWKASTVLKKITEIL